MNACKDEIRAAMRARRKAVTPAARAAVGKELSRRLFAEDRALGAAISAKGPIAVYLASKEEIDLTDFIAAALSVGCILVAPRWNGTDYELVRLQDLTTLVKGPHAILEPPAGPVVRPKTSVRGSCQASPSPKTADASAMAAAGTIVFSARPLHKRRRSASRMPFSSSTNCRRNPTTFV